jgi:hypothetical protein
VIIAVVSRSGNANLGAVLKAVARRRRLKLREFAKTLGISYRTLVRWRSSTDKLPRRRVARVIQRLAEHDPAAAQKLAASFRVKLARPQATPAVPTGPLASVAAQLALIAETLGVAPAIMRDALIRMLDAAIAHQWSVERLRGELQLVADATAAARAARGAG